MRRVAVIVPCVFVFFACEANFRDLRPEDPVEQSAPDVGPSAGDAEESTTDAGRGDTGNGGMSGLSDVGDSGGAHDTSEGDSGAGEGMDSGGDDAGERLAAVGTFESRDYDAEGTVRLVELADGSWELRLDRDFQVESTPGPVVVLTSRKTMGSEIKPGEGDEELGVLRSDSGADTYEVPDGPGSRRNAFIFCKPFGGEIGRAIMEAP